MLSLLLFCCESVPAWSTSNQQVFMWFALESAISVHFVLDMLLKLTCQPTLTVYLQSWDALIDVLTVIPWIFDFYWLFPALTVNGVRRYTSLRLLRLVRFARFFRITLGNFPRIGLFFHAVRRSGLAFMFLFVYVFGAGLLFSGGLFFAETSVCVLQDGVWLLEADKTLLCSVQNMFDAIWLCVVTMATVGYGDIVPQTPLGKLLSGLIMLTSVIFLPLPTSIFAANLTELYLESSGRDETDEMKMSSHYLTSSDPHQLPLHRAFSIFLFNPQHRLLLQRRALGKHTFPGIWSNTVCSHPLRSDADICAAIQRKLQQELGIDGISSDELVFMGKMRYAALSADPNWVKDVTVRPNQEEVMETRWVGPEELRIELAERPDIYTPWFKAIARDMLLANDSPWHRLNNLSKITPLKETLVYHDPLQ
ncbi:Isopentenyl-diphosphate delta-isomerase [Paramicrosporidium saccamoebae]|uniref:isopentenyl-diphosphate Delta-isomerase n=1 Tax=Paramicrosporidium saccamoebae TaxID=1246581 RepID=A0A2H9TMV9_9FUNG|nr:Isopentenyl-diphosphate delta-isomerase [Paramicrosporidium saccamoebae]